MANEAILRERHGHPIDFTVADGAIEKGTICKMTDPRTAAANDGNGDVFAGIAAREKVASDGRTRLALFRSGIFDCVTSGSVTTGQWLSTSGANVLKTATEAEIAAGKGVGIALEDGSGGETIQVMIGGYGG